MLVVANGLPEALNSSDYDTSATKSVTYSKTSLVAAIVIAAGTTLLTAVVIALIVRYVVKSRQNKKQVDSMPTVVIPAGPRADALSSWGFDSVRSSTSIPAPDDSIDTAVNAVSSNTQ
jgi:hypothetical protein